MVLPPHFHLYDRNQSHQAGHVVLINAITPQPAFIATVATAATVIAATPFRHPPRQNCSINHYPNDQSHNTDQRPQTQITGQ